MFGVKMDGAFVAGRPATGTLTYKGEIHTLEMRIERIDPEHYFAYRWHPYAIDTKQDYSAEPMTLVEFRLKPVPEGTELTVIETGFDRIPAHRRDEAYRMNDGGWKSQIENLRRYVTS